MSGIWSEVAVLEDPSLRSLVPDLLDLQMGSRASSTVTNYKSGWLRWRAWASLASRLFLRNLCILRFLCFLLQSLLTIALRAIWVYPLKKPLYMALSGLTHWLGWYHAPLVIP